MNGLVVVVPAVHVVVKLPIVMARLAVGDVRADHRVEAVPEQEPKTGVPPFVETRQRVPAPPVGVENRPPDAFVYTTPFEAGPVTGVAQPLVHTITIAPVAS